MLGVCHWKRAERVEEPPVVRSEAEESEAMLILWGPFDSAASEAAPLRVTIGVFHKRLIYIDSPDARPRANAAFLEPKLSGSAG